MTFRSSIPAACGLLLSLGLLLASPQPASAAEVMCSNDFGDCTVSNDGQSWASCSCANESGTGGTGGDEYAGLTEAELLEICHDELAWCDGQGGDGDGDGCDTGTTGGDPTGGDLTGGDTGFETGFDTGGEGDTGFETGGEGETGCDPTDGETGFDTGDESTGDGDGDGGGTAEGDTGDPTEGDPTTGSGDDGGDGDGDPTGGETTGDGDGDGETTGGVTTDDGDSANSEEDTGGESDGGNGETGLAADDVEGVGCSVTSHSGFGLIGLALLGLFGIHRRERKLAA